MERTWGLQEEDLGRACPAQGRRGGGVGPPCGRRGGGVAAEKSGTCGNSCVMYLSMHLVFETADVLQVVVVLVDELVFVYVDVLVSVFVKVLHYVLVGILVCVQLQFSR